MRKNGYSIVVSWSSKDCCFVAQSPSIEGCISKGKSVADATKEIQQELSKMRMATR
ncbi:hypothetical protein SAMN04487761_11913 [Lachnospiraceae bacterium C7]|nr:hypothetical protein SAMN04487761_11913 [Lachnospiraceae bacterium C7]